MDVCFVVWRRAGATTLGRRTFVDYDVTEYVNGLTCCARDTTWCFGFGQHGELVVTVVIHVSWVYGNFWGAWGPEVKKSRRHRR